MDNVIEIIIGVVILGLGIFKTILDDKKKESSKVVVDEDILNMSQPKPEVESSHSRLDSKAEGLRAIEPSIRENDIPADSAPQRQPRRRRSALRSAFINSEIFNRKF